MVYIFSDIKFSLDIDSLSQFFKMTLYPIFFLKQQLLLVLCTHQGFLRFRISFKVSLGVPDSSNIKGWTQDSRNALGFDNTWGYFVRISKILWDCNLTKCYNVENLKKCMKRWYFSICRTFVWSLNAQCIFKSLNP